MSANVYNLKFNYVCDIFTINCLFVVWPIFKRKMYWKFQTRLKLLKSLIWIKKKWLLKQSFWWQGKKCAVMITAFQNVCLHVCVCVEEGFIALLTNIYCFTAMLIHFFGFFLSSFIQAFTGYNTARISHKMKYIILISVIVSIVLAEQREYRLKILQIKIIYMLFKKYKHGKRNTILFLCINIIGS